MSVLIAWLAFNLLVRENQNSDGVKEKYRGIGSKETTVRVLWDAMLDCTY
jgi:hypothetical protein